MRAIALYPCVAEEPAELSFTVGQVIYDVKPSEEEGWFWGKLDSEKPEMGLFPANYVRLEEDPPGPPIGLARKLSFRAAAPASESWLTFIGKGGAGTTKRSQEPDSIPSTDLGSTSKIDANATRRALSVKSEELIQAAKLKRNNSGNVSNTGNEIKTVSRSSSSNSVSQMGTGEPSTSMAARLKQFESRSSSAESLTGTGITGGRPSISSKPPLLVSNQSYTKPALPSRPSSMAVGTLPKSQTSSSESIEGTSSSIRKRPPAPPRKPVHLSSVISNADIGSEVSSNSGDRASQLQSIPLPSQIISQQKNGSRPAVPSRPSSMAVRSPSESLSSTSSSAPKPKTKNPFDTAESRQPPAIPSDAWNSYAALFQEEVRKTDPASTGPIQARKPKLGGMRVRSIWLKSGLDNRTLAQVWNLTDVNDDGELTLEQFCVGMHLIDERLNGVPVPEDVPSDVASILEA